MTERYFEGEVDCSLKELWYKGYNNFSEGNVQTGKEKIPLTKDFHIKGTFRRTADGIKFSGELSDNKGNIHNGTSILFNEEGDISKVTKCIEKYPESYSDVHDFIEENYQKGTLMKRKTAGNVYLDSVTNQWVSDSPVKFETYSPDENDHVIYLMEYGIEPYNTVLTDGIPDDCLRREKLRYTLLKTGEKDGICEEFSDHYGAKNYTLEEYRNLKTYVKKRTSYKKGVKHGLETEFDSKKGIKSLKYYQNGEDHTEKYNLMKGIKPEKDVAQKVETNSKTETNSAIINKLRKLGRLFS